MKRTLLPAKRNAFIILVMVIYFMVFKTLKKTFIFRYCLTERVVLFGFLHFFSCMIVRNTLPVYTSEICYANDDLFFVDWL